MLSLAPHRARPLAALAAAAALLLPAGPAAALQGSGRAAGALPEPQRAAPRLDVPSAEASLRALRPPRAVPARPFSWSDPVQRRGTVDVPIGLGGGWTHWPPVLQWRFVHPVTTDPILEVIVHPPYSGHATLPELFKLQVPLATPPSQRGLLVAYHSFSVSEEQFFQNTTLPAECAERGWLLLAPYGLVDVNFGNEPSQRANEAAIALVATFFPFDFDRLYTFGFSMGGLNAASFALRHQDPGELRVAGVVYHTGTTDVVRDYQEGSLDLKEILEDALVFGGSPTQVPFAYDRVNPMAFLPSPGGFDPAKAQMHSLVHTPLYLFAKTNDPTKYDEWTMDLEAELVAQGASVTSVFDGSGLGIHSVASIDESEALDWAEAHPLGPLPTAARLFADRPGTWLWSRLVSEPGGVVARWTVEIDAAANAFDVADTHAVGTLAFDLERMQLDPTQPLTFTAASGDATPDTYVLEGYVAAPSSVLVDGGPPLAWSHDAVTASLTIEPNAGGAAATIQVLP